jgi:hypothetical protein
MLSPDQRLLLGELKEFLTALPAEVAPGRPEWRAVLMTRIDTTLAADAEQEAMIGGIRGAFTRWLSKGK